MNALQRYFDYRQALIDQYVKGDLTKKEYLNKNLEAVLALRDEPFKNVDTVDKGLFNYQFFNAMAKDARMEVKQHRSKEYVYIYEEQVNYYYDRKDGATLRILQLLDYCGVRAYFIKVRSRELKHKLFEIVLEDKEGMILHSTSDVILKRLREENCFSEGEKKSLIDYYINHKY